MVSIMKSIIYAKKLRSLMQAVLGGIGIPRMVTTREMLVGVLNAVRYLVAMLVALASIKLRTVWRGHLGVRMKLAGCLPLLEEEWTSGPGYGDNYVTIQSSTVPLHQGDNRDSDFD